MSNPYPPPPRPTTDESFWVPAAHWTAIVLLFVTSGALAFVAPLVIMLTKGTESPRVRQHAKESLNFQLSMLIYAIVTGVVAIIGAVLSVILIGFPILVIALLALLAIAACALIFPIVATVKASNGEDYRYPLTLRLVS